MTQHTQTTDQKIINSRAMQYLMRFPAAGRVLRVTSEGAGLAVSIADALGEASEAVPFTLALRSLQVVRAQTTDQVSIWSASLEYRMPFPAAGRLIRVKEIDAGVLEVTVADELGRPQDANPFTSAFRALTVEPILDPDDPFRPYYPGLESQYHHHRSQSNPRPGVSGVDDGQPATPDSDVL